MNLTDKMAYLRGMVDGMELDLTSSKEGKVLGQLLDVMQEVTAYVADLQTQVDELTEICDLRIWVILRTFSMKRKTRTRTILTWMTKIMRMTMCSMKRYVPPVTMSSHWMSLFWKRARFPVPAAARCWNLI